MKPAIDRPQKSDHINELAGLKGFLQKEKLHEFLLGPKLLDVITRCSYGGRKKGLTLAGYCRSTLTRTHVNVLDLAGTFHWPSPLIKNSVKKGNYIIWKSEWGSKMFLFSFLVKQNIAKVFAFFCILQCQVESIIYSLTKLEE